MNEMLENVQAKLKTRTIAVFSVVHVGLILGIIAISRASFAEWDLTSSFYLASLLCLYGGFVMGILFIILPLLPWLKKARSVEHWTERALKELPHLIRIVQSLLAVWNEARNPASAPKSAETQPVKASEPLKFV
ncbi:MAG: hypothetical protein H7222_05575 [Methylotenera sp.]|nr:hypothetical protein [Oligoflexia bacterium]